MRIVIAVPRGRFCFAFIGPKETTIMGHTFDNRLWLHWTADSPEICRLHIDAPQWWRDYGPVVKAAILSVMRLDLQRTEEERMQTALDLQAQLVTQRACERALQQTTGWDDPNCEIAPLEGK